MAQQVTNIGEHRPPEQQAAPQPNLPPPAVAVPRPRQRNDWAYYAVGLGAIAAFCYFAEEILVVILISVLLAFVLAPVADLLSRLRLPRWAAAGMAVFLLLVVLAGITYYGINQILNLIDHLPQYSGKLHEEVAKISRKAQTLENINPAQKGTIKVHETQSWADLLSHGFGSATEIALAGSFIPFLIFFMLTWQEHARAATVGLFRLEDRREAYTTIGQIASMVRRFILGNLVIALVVGAVSTVVFGFLHIPFFYFVGFAAGFLTLVPYLGLILAMLPPLFVDIGHLTLSEVIWVALTIVTLHLVALNVLYPKFLGSRLRLNPLAVTISLLVWAWLWGAVGLILAIPVTAAVKIVFDHVQALKPFGAWLGEEFPQNGAANGTH